MEQTVLLGIMAIMVSASGALGWMIGDHLGMRRAASRLARRRASMAAGKGPVIGKAKRGRVRITPAPGPAGGQNPRDLFLDMPSLPELASEIATIRAHEPLWVRAPQGERAGSDADDRAILEHYREAISELAALQPGREFVRPAQPSPWSTLV